MKNFREKFQGKISWKFLEGKISGKKFQEKNFRKKISGKKFQEKKLN